MSCAENKGDYESVYGVKGSRKQADTDYLCGAAEKKYAHKKGVKRIQTVYTHTDAVGKT